MRKRIIKHLVDVLSEFNEGEITNVSDIASRMNRKFGNIRYSTSEIAGNITKVPTHYILQSGKDEYGLNYYRVHKV